METVFYIDFSRTIHFILSDGRDTNTVPIVFSIVPINDAPILTSSITEVLYVEDDEAVSIADNISVSDIDSDISDATVIIIGLVDGDNDVVSFNTTLASQYGIDISMKHNVSDNSAILYLSGNATDAQYQEVSEQQ